MIKLSVLLSGLKHCIGERHFCTSRSCHGIETRDPIASEIDSLYLTTPKHSGGEDKLAVQVQTPKLSGGADNPAVQVQ